MNEAVKLFRRLYSEGQSTDVIGTGTGEGPLDIFSVTHPDARHSLFGPSGVKEELVGREAFRDFVNRCAGALSDRSDEIIAISGIDEHSVFVHGLAFRKSASNGEEIRYEWAILARVENGLITYVTDMLDPDAQAFWGRVLSPAPGG